MDPELSTGNSSEIEVLVRGKREARSLCISQIQKGASKEKQSGGGSGVRQLGFKSWFSHILAV